MKRNNDNDSVDLLQSEIQDLQIRIQKLQESCTHTDFDVAFYSWRPGAMQPSHICVKCRKYLGTATKEESDKLWNDSGFGVK